ncbi:MAG: cupin domain-containing protein [Candidatus Promineifilaceae bacterium]|nr:cupin domain-containing protein [Candidatus Promineifilaceae bacterium]
MEYKHIADLPALIGEIPEDAIISRTICKEPGEVNTTLFGFAAGQELTEHTATKPALLYFLRGRARLTLGDDAQEGAPGTFVYMPPHLPHSILAEEETVMLLVLVG